ncbi:MAG: hypothetical protein V1692_00725 [bacterium]
MNSLYRPILKQAWFHTWRHKFLWLFGFFAAWLGTSGEYELFIRSFDRINEKGSLLININQFIATTGVFSANTVNNLKMLATTRPLDLVWLILLFLVIILAGLFIVWAVVTAQGSLISSIRKVAKNQPANFQDGLDAGLAKFWPILWLNLIYRLIVFILFLALGVIFAYFFANVFVSSQANAGLGSFILFLVGFIIFLPLVFVVSFIIRYAACYAVIKNFRFKEAIRQGILLFAKNWLISLELSLILLFLHIAVAIAIILLVIVVGAPLILLLSMLYAMSFAFGFYTVVMITIFILLAVIILAVSLFSTYLWSCWTLLFLQLTEKGGTSKLVRLANNIPGIKRQSI